MTRDEINDLLTQKPFPDFPQKVELIQTHISWVILSSKYAYKIKKPLKLPFLDFTGIEQRRYYCERELELNKRLAPQLYKAVLPIKKSGNNFSVGKNQGQTIDYCLQMEKLDTSRQMDQLLIKNKVTSEDIVRLAKQIANFHNNTNPVRKEYHPQFYLNEFKDILQVFPPELNEKYRDIVLNSVHTAEKYLSDNELLISSRFKSGCIKDCHGDLHCRNIFIYDVPVVYDCIEFNDEFRYIDILNEVAFLCMDLEKFDRPDLSNLFLNEYLKYSKSAFGKAEYYLFIYFKMYRANIRSKVSLIQAGQNKDQHQDKIEEALNYIKLIKNYNQILQQKIK